MKKALVVILLVILVSLSQKLELQAMSPNAVLAGLKETEEERAKKEIWGICNSLKKSIDAENGECWRRTIHPLKMERYDIITKVFENLSDHFKWEMKVTELDENNFQITLINNYYLIKKGDTLSSIAKKYDTSVDNLMELNSDIVDENLIYYNTYLKIE